MPSALVPWLLLNTALLVLGPRDLGGERVSGRTVPMASDGEIRRNHT